ncbi:lytic transglycosylase domain-containing protein [Devosia sp. SL43]|uniref:lytic transglycosylase domain-containing protein n=1 Tax=Devosia sp. SL43 TaxID=2806348 RepID=UPI002351C082|nr:lytic transglycosylase domain-containing protein [Devosia sp. SL43]
MRLALATILLLMVGPATAEDAATPPEAPRCGTYIGQSVCIAADSYVADVCAAIETYADHYMLPPAFFARLIWQESRFDPNAISPAGAQGIAQFIPSTAALRSLQSPFDPVEALFRSAEYLRFLEIKFGNLGLAAAAYNGGERRISDFLAGAGGVAAETRGFVSVITGQSIDYWRSDIAAVDYDLHPDKPFAQACADMASRVAIPTIMAKSGEWQPWGVLIAENFSPEIARAAFTRVRARYAELFDGHDMLFITGRNLSLGTRLRYAAQVGFPDREQANAFCSALTAQGGACLVRRNE